MFIVLIMGAMVTATGSGEGCGQDWPLCEGSFLPAGSVESLIEYSHRIVTGIIGFIVLATSISAWRIRRRHPEFTFLVPAMAATLIIQSLMGAAAVRWPQTPEVMATHFGISLVCLAAAALIARILTESSGKKGDPWQIRLHRSQTRAPVAFRWFIFAIMLISVGVAYSGAYVRHTGAELACTSWPTCSGQLIPEFGGLAGIHTLHRLAALVITLLAIALLAWAFTIRHRREDLFTIAKWSMVLVVLQSLAGAAVVFSGVQLLTALTHAGLMAIFFVVLCDGVRCIWPIRETATATVIPPQAAPRSATGD